MKQDLMLIRIVLISALLAVAPQSRAFDLSGSFFMGIANTAGAITIGETTILEFNVWKLYVKANVWRDGVLDASRNNTCSKQSATEPITCTTSTTAILPSHAPCSLEYCGSGSGISYTSTNQAIDAYNWGLNGLGELNECELWFGGF